MHADTRDLREAAVAVVSSNKRPLELYWSIATIE
jgi:hypothetical protein